MFWAVVVRVWAFLSVPGMTSLTIFRVNVFLRKLFIPPASLRLPPRLVCWEEVELGYIARSSAGAIVVGVWFLFYLFFWTLMFSPRPPLRACCGDSPEACPLFGRLPYG